MLIEIPVPNIIEARLNRSRTGTTEKVYACSAEVFELQEVSSADVHLVAEWRQSWNRKEPIDEGARPSGNGSWAEVLISEPDLTRIAMIDGQFFSPLKFQNHLGEMTLVTRGNLTKLILRSGSVKDFGGEYGSGFWSGHYKQTLLESGYIRSMDDCSDVVPDLKARTVVSETIERVRDGIKQRLASMCIIDGAVFVNTAEPILALFFSAEDMQLRPYQPEAFVSASDRATSFSMLDYDAAIEFAEENFPGVRLDHFVSRPTVFIPDAFKADRNRAEMIKLVEYLLTYTEKHLHTLSSESGNAWFQLRDASLAAGDEPTSDQLDELATKAHTFSASMSRQQFSDKMLQLVGRTGLMHTERWNLRPLNRVGLNY